MTSPTSSLDEVLAAHVARAVATVAAELQRPTHVNQRTVERVVGLVAIDFLELAREGRFQTWKVRRCIYARTADVVAFVEASGRPVRERPAVIAPANDAAALARVGARRVAP